MYPESSYPTISGRLTAAVAVAVDVDDVALRA